MKFYTYNQNNSGGSFMGPAMYVIVEAKDAMDADRIAQDHGVYFDGVMDQRDCPCCGDRWYSMFGDEATDVPSIYSTPVSEYFTKKYPDGAWEKESRNTRRAWAEADKTLAALVIYADGHTESFR